MSTKPRTSTATGSKTSSTRPSSGTKQQQQRPVDPMGGIPADVVWGSRPGQAANDNSATKRSPTKQAAGASDGDSPNNHQHQQQNRESKTQKSGTAAVSSPQQNNAKFELKGPTSSSPPQNAKEQAAAKAKSAQQAAQHAAAALKTSSTVLSEELSLLKDENAQLRDIEKQFWLLLDEREQLQDEVRNLTRGIRNNNNNSSSSFAPRDSAGAVVPRAPSDGSEAEKNYSQMASALDEALTMLLQLDRTAASRLSSGSSAPSVVTPGTLIHRFLEFCSSERLGGGHHHHASGSSMLMSVTSPGGDNNNNNNRKTDDSFVSRASQMIHNMHQQTAANAQPSLVAISPGNNRSASQQQQQHHDHSAQSLIHTSNLSQALRVAQDEIHHLKMELDRSDLSRLQALDDVDKMQGQIKLLSQSVVELRSAYASARAQADANARSAETVHEVTVRLAERDAEIAHLKARIAELQRLAASGGSALASDTARIRNELQARVGR